MPTTAPTPSFPELPAGLTARRATLDDVEAATRFFNECDRAIAGRDWHSTIETRWIWTHPDLDLDSDTLIVCDKAGRIVGYEQVWTMSPAIEHRLWGRVARDMLDRGIGSALVQWGEREAAIRLDRAPPGAKVTTHLWSFTNDEASRRLFVDHGYACVRHMLEMQIDFEAPLPTPTWPPGIDVRPFEPTQLRAVYEARTEAFRDHWGIADTDVEQGLERFRHHIDGDEQFDPNLWLLAWEGDEIAALCLCRLESEQDPMMGWIEDLAVRRPWRRRGLAKALLLHAFEALRRRDRTSAGLAVDAGSLTGAVRLYEQVGMRVSQSFDRYAKTLRDGEDLATRELDGD